MGQSENIPRNEMDAELEHDKTIVYQKIGRNVVLFQKIEWILKYLAANANIEGYASEIQTIAEQQAARINTQTMGQLVGRFVENTYTESENLTNAPEDLKEPWLTFGFTIQGEGLYERRKEALASVVAERNALIHHFVPTWNWESKESSREAEEHLDRQYDTSVAELKGLQEEANWLQQQRKALAEYMRSDAYKQTTHMLELRKNQLIVSLGNVSRYVPRKDGWMVLSTAAQHLSQEVREKIAVLKRGYGYKTLKEIMLATELFDFREDAMGKGGIRVLYRIKPEFSAWAID